MARKSRVKPVSKVVCCRRYVFAGARFVPGTVACGDADAVEASAAAKMAAVAVRMEERVVIDMAATITQSAARV